MVFIMRQLKVQRVMYSPQLAFRLSLALRRLYLQGARGRGKIRSEQIGPHQMPASLLQNRSARAPSNTPLLTRPVEALRAPRTARRARPH